MKVCQVKQKCKIVKERTPFTTDTAKFSEGRIRWSYRVSLWFQCITPAFTRTFQNNYSQLPSISVFILFFSEEQLNNMHYSVSGSRGEKIVFGDHPPPTSHLKVWARHCYLKTIFENRKSLENN